MEAFFARQWTDAEPAEPPAGSGAYTALIGQGFHHKKIRGLRSFAFLLVVIVPPLIGIGV